MLFDNIHTILLFLHGQCFFWDLQFPIKVLTHLAISVRELISSSASSQFNVVYRDEVVIACLQHCWGGKGAAFSSDVIR